MTEEFIWIFLLNTACGLFMTGIIWFVQLVQYPGLAHLDKADFRLHHRHLAGRMILVSLPVMSIELLSGFFLVFNAEEYFLYHLSGLTLILLIWLSTLFIQIPLHNRLRKDFNEEIIGKLTDTNWLRTLLWSVKSLVSLHALMTMITS